MSLTYEPASEPQGFNQSNRGAGFTFDAGVDGIMAAVDLRAQFYHTIPGFTLHVSVIQRKLMMTMMEQGFNQSNRGAGFTFGADVVQRVCDVNRYRFTTNIERLWHR